MSHKDDLVKIGDTWQFVGGDIHSGYGQRHRVIGYDENEVITWSCTGTSGWTFLGPIELFLNQFRFVYRPQ